MQVKRFVAADMRRALELVRQELGPDAIILSSGRVPEGVELLTTTGSDSELAQLQQQPLGRMALASASPMMSDGAWAETEVIERAAKQHVNSSFASTLAASKSGSSNSGKSGKQLVDDIEQARLRMLASQKAEESAKEFLVGKNTVVNASIPRHAAAAKTPVTQPQAAVIKVETKSSRPQGRKAVAAPVETKVDAKAKSIMSAAERYPLVDDEDKVSLNSKSDRAPAYAANQANELHELQAEIADMRFLLEQQLDRLTGTTTPAANSPVLGSVGRRLERLGLPSALVGNVLNRCTKTKSVSDAWPDALANLAHQLPVAGRDIVDQGGVFAFVGPTGVGKTTTIGKLAARYVLQHGADKVALITTDTYRIAAHDQLRSLARILRVPVRVVDESNSLESLLRSLRHCSLILIDTAGFRHGDPHLKAQLKALADQPQVKSLLVLSCNSQEQMLKASVHAYGAARLQGCVLTKLDETASMGEALGVVAQNRLPVVYTTDGQDIPKNIEVARAHQLVAKAVALLKTNPASAVS
ncbi:flagellar biosynthesis regulator FlhF [Cellvibrio zantedeschiae]|uniref:Flagellar biosynthesis protein FlhF n=1 Tax=Cellvibrio zantedeschiae TaxID=1237077 RepID=A0ABQ3ATR1_9GAMM|nr:flagellar biosynthesis protein FlhF [Cellvibrio zantedeschiae]GGY67374.1 flagellar biosynthesis regulator FlhF [Cellvibrio zantedeschiae]